ncbi:hypothetical protein BDV29DRAFT_55929 [Aspergillus leporis]|uniref:Uncharacterized protein n=1 Tax=Aspergillus leporis TaxID=41062 RepID=A0A5N5XD82_9EURO|nr:hypothetical protein BDV29DRAFT_55929 [Aspergillus leporis]
MLLSGAMTPDDRYHGPFEPRHGLLQSVFFSLFCFLSGPSIETRAEAAVTVGWLVGYILRPWLTAEAVTNHPRLGQRPPGGKPWVSLTSCWF